MRWVRYIVNDLGTSIGGFPTFCEDPDELLQLPEVRTALESAGMTLQYWDGMPEPLAAWSSVPASEKPLVIVEPDYPKHLVEAKLKNYLFESISIGEIFGKFHYEVVKALPVEHWDALYDLHQIERPHRTPEETALLIGRAFYGVDPLYLSFGNGWTMLLTVLATTGNVLPPGIAKALLQTVKPPVYMSTDEAYAVLTDPVVARSKVKHLLSVNGVFAEEVSPNRTLALKMIAEAPGTYSVKRDVDWHTKWNEIDQSPASVLSFSLTYGQACASGDVSLENRATLNRSFFAWLRINYVYAMTSQDPSVLRLPTLVKCLHEDASDTPLLLVVVDALGLEGWFAVKDLWKGRIGYSSESERGAFAILPTLTNLSRRAIFEGKVPTQFGSNDHSQDLERRAWKERFGDDGGYFTPGDTVKLDYAFARRTKRIAIVDTSWDSIGHSIYPQSDSIAAAAKRWGQATPLADIIRSALERDYRVVITADHGQIGATGIGRLNIGALSEQRSKRAVLFDNDSLLQGFASKGITDYQPYGIPETMKVLFARDLTNFDLNDVQSVSHGGASIEEAIVPVVEVLA